jgi:hypothetical protein
VQRDHGAHRGRSGPASPTTIRAPGLRTATARFTGVKLARFQSDDASRFWNDGSEDARSIQFFRRALEIASFFETLFTLAQEGKLDERGMPRPLQLAVTVPEFAEEIRPVSPPWPILRVLTAVLGPIARLRGYRGRA